MLGGGTGEGSGVGGTGVSVATSGCRAGGTVAVGKGAMVTVGLGGVALGAGVIAHRRAGRSGVLLPRQR